MSDTCNNKNPLSRDGTSQAQRLLNALLPSYVLVDERSLDDLVAFVQKFATQVNYFNLADAVNGDWVGFFTKTISDEQRTEPHYALLISFLEIFKIAQDDLNTITQRHLDFYYHEVLNLQEKPAVPDQVYVIFKLAQQVSDALVPKGKELNAKKDATGIQLVYDTDKDIVVNKGVVEELKAVFINRPIDPAASPQEFPDLIPVPDPAQPVSLFQRNEWRIYSSPVANSSDGIGGDLTGDEKRWRIFGRPQPVSDGSSVADRPQADVGFAFASPLLFLAEGTRTVTIRINSQRAVRPSPVAVALQAPTSIATSYATHSLSAQLRSVNPSLHASIIANFVINQQNNALKGAISVYFSGEKGWIAPEIETNTYFDTNGDLVIERTLTKGQKPVVAYDQSVLLQPFNTQWPVVKIMLNPDHAASPYIYEQLSPKNIYTADLTVDVVDVKNVIVQSEDTVLATEKPFTPFGSQPVVGSTFYIGSNEIFQKKLSELDVAITWHGLPDVSRAPEGFVDYYNYYLPEGENLKRQTLSFKVDAALIDKQSWHSLNTSNNGYGLFQPKTQLVGTVYRHPVDEDITLTLNTSFLAGVPRDPYMDPVEEFTATTKKGFLRLTLADVDFGHGIFQNSYAKQAIELALQHSGANLPNEPYTPTIKEISVNYRSTERVNLTRQNDDAVNEANYKNRVEQFFHVLPFGVAENHPFITKQTKNINLLPQFRDEGELFIGVSGLQTPETLSILFKVAEGSADPDLEKQKVNWSYLYNNEWYDFTQLQILSDGTNGLLTSGIVTFDLPKAFNNTNTALPDNLFWIRVSVEHDSAAVCDLVDVIAQAVTATFTDNGNDPDHLRTPLPANTISDFINSDAAIDKISQPYSSFGGHIKEQSNEFYRRVSERLRHKDRAVTPWDYEHLVLEQFPTLYKVKCLNHTRYSSLADINELVAGHVTLVIISNLLNKNAVDPLQPKTSLITLEEIIEYVDTIKPPAAELHVRNPIFEEIRVEFNVRFLPGYDNGFYGKQLNEEIRQFLAPWAYGTKDIAFGGAIHKSMIINFVEERPYVDYVTCFNMDQVVPVGKNLPPTILKNVETAETTTSASVLTSYPQHSITVLETDECACDDNLVLSPVPNPDQPCDDCGDNKEKIATGIGADEIDSTFIVGHAPRAGIDFWVLEKDFIVQ
ncbi:MAG TPA: baseplate J/gp47 family protein [Bacteroidia bacterium]|nr:baseplate J/gp47 family protein [Bacteroidia bacterium]